LDEFFPGILDELVAHGAPVWDDGELSKFYLSYSGHETDRSGTFPGDHRAVGDVHGEQAVPGMPCPTAPAND
jgi:hypothetical protein